MLATAREEESLEGDTATSVASDSSSPLGGIDAGGSPPRFSRGETKEAGMEKEAGMKKGEGIERDFG